MKTIYYYKRRNYGQTLEYVAPQSGHDAEWIRFLTRTKTVTPAIRDALTAVSGGHIAWQEVVAPN